MFLRFPFQFVNSISQTVLVINTVLLLVVLIVGEVVYSEAPLKKREHLKYLYPLILVLVALLVFAVYKQVGKG